MRTQDIITEPENQNKLCKPEIHGLYKFPLKSRNYSLLMQYTFLRSFRFGFEFRFSDLHTQRRGLTELG